MSAPMAAAGGLAGARAWVQTHQAQAAAGAGGVLVAGYALWKRRQAGSGEGAEDPQGTGTATGTDPNLVTAGLSGTPATSTTDIETWVQQALNDQNSKFQDQLDAAKPEPAPKPVQPVPAPRPGTLRYQIVPGDTLRKISTKVYGVATVTKLRDIIRANPILATFPSTAPLTIFNGKWLSIPKGTAEPKPKPKPKPPKKKGSSKPPAPKKPPKKKH